jgi:hypothetical protein
MSNVNKTQLNKLRAQIEKNKLFLSKSLWGKESEDKQYSAAVSMSVLAEYFNLDQTTGLDSVTDGQYDNKFDAIYFSDDEDELSELIIIQSKYKRTDGDTSTFTEDEIKICIGNCEKILSGENFSDSNLKITDKLKDYRDLLNGSNNPGISIKLFFATNGIIHAGHKVIKEIKDASENNIDVIFIDATFFGKNIVLEDGQLEINTKNSSDKTDSIFDIEDNLYSGAIVSCSIENLMIFYKECGEKYLLNNNVR